MSETITEAMEDAIVDWIIASSGVAEGQIVWANQGTPQQAGIWLALRIEGERSLGQPWKEARKVHGGPPLADTELVHTSTATATLRIECYTGGLSWQAARPDRVLSRIKNARTLPGVLSKLRAANVGLGPAGLVQSANYERSTVFEPRAFIEFTLNLIAQASELGTRIEKAEITNQVAPVPFTFTVAPFVEASAGLAGAVTISTDAVKV